MILWSGHPRSRRAPARRALGSLFWGALCLIALAATVARAQSYVLQPGDMVRISVAGMPEMTASAMIEGDGYLRLPQFDRAMAAGLDIDALSATFRTAIEGRLFKRFDATGAASFFSVSADDAHLSVESYRPVYVSGSVARPGPVPFRAGLTVRAAIATAGGASKFAQTGGDTPLQIAPRLQADYRALALEQARLRTRIWRIEAELADGDIDTPPTPADLGVPPETAESLLGVQRKQIQLAQAALSSEDAFLNDALTLTDGRIGILREQEARQAEAVKQDEAEQTRIAALRDRGVVPMDRLLDIRRALLLSSSRLLQTQNDIERIELDRKRLAANRAATGETRARTLIVDLDAATARLGEVTIRLAAAREALEINGIQALGVDPSAEPETAITIHRGVGAAAASIPAGMDDLVEPGDVIEVVLGAPTP